MGLEAGDANMAATTLSVKAHMSWSGGRGTRVRLAEAARWSARGMAALHLRNWQKAIDHLTIGLNALPEEYRRDRTWYQSCLAHALASAGETAQALAVATTTVPDAAAIGRPHSWNELHTTAAVLLRHRAKKDTNWSPHHENTTEQAPQTELQPSLLVFKADCSARHARPGHHRQPTERCPAGLTRPLRLRRPVASLATAHAI
jgi:hypothetical protein